MSEGERNEDGDQTALESLDREIDKETEAIADLRRRAHTLEIEIAAWKPEPPPLPARKLPVQGGEMMLGVFIGIVSMLLSMLFWGKS